MNSAALMIQGTSSDAGKSLFVTALCRILARRGVRVAPFKPQNMALNSAVTKDGGEIGRAQALQAFAAGLEPTTDMNPVLLKPMSDTGSEVIVNGRAVGVMNAARYHAHKPALMHDVMAAYHRLKKEYDVVLVEGAGSPAEINLRDDDIANMGFAEAADLPVWLVADIERGGVFAQIVGTLALLTEAERKRITGVAINRFRGDLTLLNPGLQWLVEKHHVPLIGVMPYLKNLRLDAEDSLGRRGATEGAEEEGVVAGGGGAVAGEEGVVVRGEGLVLKVAIPLLPRMSNHTDFEPLVDHPQVAVTFVRGDEPFPATDLFILPGTKSVIADREWLRVEGFDEKINRHLRYGGKVLGICGGFQMLGRSISDPHGVEGGGVCRGLSLLDIDTTLGKEKLLANRVGGLAFTGAAVSGYEIHTGASVGPALQRPFCTFTTGSDGAVSLDGEVAGTYLHGLFDRGEALAAILKWAGLDAPVMIDRAEERMREVDRLADAMEANLDLTHLAEWRRGA